MLTTIQRWGNSLAIRIPRPFALETDLQENSEVDISLDEGRIVVRPARKAWQLAELVKAITHDNLHEEAEWGTKTGGETW